MCKSTLKPNAAARKAPVGLAGIASGSSSKVIAHCVANFFDIIDIMSLMTVSIFIYPAPDCIAYVDDECATSTIQ